MRSVRPCYIRIRHHEGTFSVHYSSILAIIQQQLARQIGLSDLFSESQCELQSAVRAQKQGARDAQSDGTDTLPLCRLRKIFTIARGK